MSGNELGRRIHVALLVLLSIGVAGSFWMSLRARSIARERAVDQAQDIAEGSLTTVFRPEDFERPVTGTRVTDLAQAIEDVVMDPSDFASVTLFAPSGQILFSTEDGKIGHRLNGERGRIREALRGEPQDRTVGDTLSVMIGLQLPSGVGDPVAVELLRPADDIAAAAGSWQTNMFFLGGALALVLFGGSGLGRRGPVAVSPQAGRVRVPVIPSRQPGSPARKVIEAPHPGLKEEAEARRRAEDRAQAAEKRLVLLQEQYRATLDELQASQRMLRDRPDGQDRQLEERAVKAEAAARTLEQRLHSVTVERDRIAGELLARRDELVGPGNDLLHQAEAEAIGLRAELEGAQTQLSLTIQELSAIQRQAERSRELQEELDAAQLESLHARDAMDAMQTELGSARAELEDARSELRALRTEEQRAAELTDELRTVKAELESVRASHEAELVEREADLEDKVRTLREQFQAQLAEAETAHAGALASLEQEYAERVTAATEGAKEAGDRIAAVGADLEAARSESQARAVDLESARIELQAAHDRIGMLQQELAERDAGSTRVGEETERAKDEIATLTAGLNEARLTIKETAEALRDAESALRKERAGREKLQEADAHARDEVRALTERAEHLAQELEAATHANTELNRRLQEIEARRALEMAEDEGRAHIDALLSATQERLAGQSEKLIAAEERARELERQAAIDAERLEELGSQLRQHQMADQIREIQGPKHEPVEAHVDAPVTTNGLASTPFVKEMSMDAQKSISRIMGIVQLLKHKREAKDHGQLVQQLTAHARRLGHTIRDLSDVDSLVTGSMDLDFRTTDLESLLRRVVEESGVEEDHDVRIEAEPTSIAVDRTRTEQILGGLLRSSSDRTPSGKTITLRLLRARGGALIAVEDAESASETSLSPMVRRLAEVQGGSATVEAREGGGATFQVFLPHNGSAGSVDEMPPEPVDPDDVAEESQDDPNHWVEAEQALVRELRQLSQGKAKK